MEDKCYARTGPSTCLALCADFWLALIPCIGSLLKEIRLDVISESCRFNHRYSGNQLKHILLQMLVPSNTNAPYTSVGTGLVIQLVNRKLKNKILHSGIRGDFAQGCYTVTLSCDLLTCHIVSYISRNKHSALIGSTKVVFNGWVKDGNSKIDLPI